MFGGGQQNMDFGLWWKELQVGFKYLLITTIAIGLFSLIFGGLFFMTLANYMPFTVYMFQIWRLLTSFLADVSIISVLFNLYLMYQTIIPFQKMYSTTYIILQIFIQTLLCNGILYVVALPCNLLGLVKAQSIVTYGMIHLLFIFLWQQAATNPDAMTRFCCFPCLIPMKVIPWVYLVFFMLLGQGNLGALIGCFLGYLQHMHLKRSLLQLRLAHYRKVQSWLPNCMKQSVGFVQIVQTEAYLRTMCKQHIQQPFRSNNPFNNPAPQINSNANPYQMQEAMNDKVQVVGKGVPIGSSSPTEPQQKSVFNSYKDRWGKSEQKLEQQSPSTQKNPYQMQKPNASEGLPNENHLINFNESMMSDHPFNMENNQELDDQERQRKQRK